MTVKEIYQDLPEETLEQLDFICNYFGHEVEYVISEDADFALSAYVNENVPIIKSIHTYNPTIGDIIHEVWHLYIKAVLQSNGYNFNGALEDDIINIYQSETKFTDIFIYLYSVLEHYYFLNKISDLYNPYDFIIKSLPDVYNYPFKSQDIYIRHNILLDQLQLLILKDKDSNYTDELKYIMHLYPDIYQIGLNLYTIIQEFDQIEVQPQVMEKLFKTLWNIEGDIVSVKQDQIIFKYKE